MVSWFGLVNETSTSTDAVGTTKTKTRSQAEVSASTDAPKTSRSAVRSSGEVSTSTDAAQALQGRSRAETSASTDAIASVVRTKGRTIAEASASRDAVVVSQSLGELQDYQFALQVAPRVPFGHGQAISGTFQPGSFSIRDQDIAGVVGDYRSFGSDRKVPPTWGWQLWTDQTTPEDALEWTELLAQVWDNEVRKSPEGAVALQYKVGGRLRRVYGRPRNFTPTPDRVQNGRIHITADFVLSEDAYYDEEEESVIARLAPAYVAGAGIVLPQPLPWVFTTQPQPKTEQMIIKGSKATWVDVVFHGPMTNPWVQIGGLTWGLLGVIGTNDSVTLSGKPWSMGVRRASGAYVPGWLDPRSRLSALQMDPGSYSVQFGGWDNTGSGSVELRWRKAHRSL